MTLHKLTEGMKIIKTNAEGGMAITGLDYDSRRISKGHAFVALKGVETDGHDYVRMAFKNGAVVAFVEREMDEDISYVMVQDTRDALARLSNNFNERPSESLFLIGITGTNGKTTTACITKSAIEGAGKSCGLIGTINYQVGEFVYPASHTTPEAIEFQALLSQMLSAGCGFVVSEVSSHGLAQKRVDGSIFRVAVFTNLTRDHLDYHKTMSEYFSAKTRLFTELLAAEGAAVINADDPYGLELREILIQKRPDVKILTYGIVDELADLVALDIRNKFSGMSFTLDYGDRRFEIKSPLMGIPNVYNILASIGASVSAGIGLEEIIKSLSTRGNISGRFEAVGSAQGFLCIVDYAHTDDALRRLILTARGFAEGRVITVFGCGGERDRGKRPLMGRTATELSDVVIITTDNPRREDPTSIIDEIKAGIERQNYSVVPDRKEAIFKAVSEAEVGDIVLIAGKGHEEYQEIDGVRHEFDDRQVLETAIKEKQERNK